MNRKFLKWCASRRWGWPIYFYGCDLGYRTGYSVGFGRGYKKGATEGGKAIFNDIKRILESQGLKVPVESTKLMFSDGEESQVWSWADEVDKIKS